MKYKDFIKSKSKTFESAGIDVDKNKLNSNMFDFQKDIVRWALKKGRAAIFAECGLGKGQPYGSKILTPKGWIEIQNLKVGDYIISSDGKPHRVKGVFPKGEIETYRFYFSDGVSCVFDKEHLHIVRTYNDIVLDPFAGIGSTNYVALKMGRRTIGIELKESYYNLALENMDKADLDYIIEGKTNKF